MAIYFSGKNYAMAAMQSHATLFTQWMFAGYTNDTIWAELKEKGYLEEQIIEIGERTVIELGIHGLHKELIRIVGKMRFRSSYGQNLLMHSRETANLCGIMAAELGMNPKLAKRAGLLHDIGKVPDEETELSLLNLIPCLALASAYELHLKYYCLVLPDYPPKSLSSRSAVLWLLGKLCLSLTYA